MTAQQDVVVSDRARSEEAPLVADPFAGGGFRGITEEK